jgi:hypothetical protein
VQGQQPRHALIPLDDEGALPAREDVLVHELLERRARGNLGVVAAQRARHRVTRERPSNGLLLHLGDGGALQEPPDERDPEAIDDVSPERLPHAEKYEEERDRAPGSRHVAPAAFVYTLWESGRLMS